MDIENQSPDAPPSFATRDPLTPAFWDERFERGYTPWDRGGVPAALRQFVQQAPTPLATLIPGCGNAHELAYLSDAGWDALAIDFSPVAVGSAQARAGKWAGRVVEADFFAFAPTFTSARALQLIYECAFLCAMPPRMWPQVAARWAFLLPAGGYLAGYFFCGDNKKGPPFGIARAQLDALLLPHFACLEDALVGDSSGVFAGKERWQIWRRKFDG